MTSNQLSSHSIRIRKVHNTEEMERVVTDEIVFLVVKYSLHSHDVRLNDPQSGPI